MSHRPQWSLFLALFLMVAVDCSLPQGSGKNGITVVDLMPPQTMYFSSNCAGTKECTETNSPGHICANTADSSLNGYVSSGTSPFINVHYNSSITRYIYNVRSSGAENSFSLNYTTGSGGGQGPLVDGQVVGVNSTGIVIDRCLKYSSLGCQSCASQQGCVFCDPYCLSGDSSEPNVNAFCNKTTSTNDYRRCYNCPNYPYYGADCDQFTCFDIPSTNPYVCNGGLCSEPDTCQCLVNNTAGPSCTAAFVTYSDNDCGASTITVVSNTVYRIPLSLRMELLSVGDLVEIFVDFAAIGMQNMQWRLVTTSGGVVQLTNPTGCSTTSTISGWSAQTFSFLYNATNNGSATWRLQISTQDNPVNLASIQLVGRVLTANDTAWTTMKDGCQPVTYSFNNQSSCSNLTSCNVASPNTTCTNTTTDCTSQTTFSWPETVSLQLNSGDILSVQAQFAVHSASAFFLITADASSPVERLDDYGCSDFVETSGSSSQSTMAYFRATAAGVANFSLTFRHTDVDGRNSSGFVTLSTVVITAKKIPHVSLSGACDATVNPGQIYSSPWNVTAYGDTSVSFEGAIQMTTFSPSWQSQFNLGEWFLAAPSGWSDLSVGPCGKFFSTKSKLVQSSRSVVKQGASAGPFGFNLTVESTTNLQSIRVAVEAVNFTRFYTSYPYFNKSAPHTKSSSSSSYTTSTDTSVTTQTTVVTLPQRVEASFIVADSNVSWNGINFQWVMASILGMDPSKIANITYTPTNKRNQATGSVDVVVYPSSGDPSTTSIYDTIYNMEGDDFAPLWVELNVLTVTRLYDSNPQATTPTNTGPIGNKILGGSGGTLALIAGASVGGVVLIIILAVLIYIFIKRNPYSRGAYVSSDKRAPEFALENREDLRREEDEDEYAEGVELESSTIEPPAEAMAPPSAEDESLLPPKYDEISHPSSVSHPSDPILVPINVAKATLARGASVNKMPPSEQTSTPKKGKTPDGTPPSVRKNRTPTRDLNTRGRYTIASYDETAASSMDSITTSSNQSSPVVPRRSAPSESQKSDIGEEEKIPFQAVEASIHGFVPVSKPTPPTPAAVQVARELPPVEVRPKTAALVKPPAKVGFTPVAETLWEAAEHDDIEVLRKLRPEYQGKSGGINPPNAIGDTPLHVACLHGSARAVRWLLRNGAKSRLRNRKGQKASEVAAEAGHAECATIIADYAKDRVRMRDQKKQDAEQKAQTTFGTYMNAENVVDLNNFIQLFKKHVMKEETSYDEIKSLFYLIVEEQHTEFMHYDQFLDWWMSFNEEEEDESEEEEEEGNQSSEEEN
ncbi:hypothetical protein PROFUN_04218 [Planoprotostelium fungivorum]|uniref:Uncharacterized protein n=1 Tax=Planoprotostelium fungivorum TaxID=1890364 RepID=A0A2P6NVY2_9EUKA|nr:hypothetical protein PROFUN_04218 [Planoprotostelium fungivorum]